MRLRAFARWGAVDSSLEAGAFVRCAWLTFGRGLTSSHSKTKLLLC